MQNLRLRAYNHTVNFPRSILTFDRQIWVGFIVERPVYISYCWFYIEVNTPCNSIYDTLCLRHCTWVAVVVKGNEICFSGGILSADSGTAGVAAENVFISFIARPMSFDGLWEQTLRQPTPHSPWQRANIRSAPTPGLHAPASNSATVFEHIVSRANEMHSTKGKSFSRFWSPSSAGSLVCGKGLVQYKELLFQERK